MTIDETLALISRSGVTIKVDGGKIGAVGTVSPVLFAALKQHRATLLSVFGDPLVQKTLNHFDGTVVHVA